MLLDPQPLPSIYRAETALRTPDGLYVRTTDHLWHVAADGTTTSRHAFADQNPFAFMGLAHWQDALYSFATPVGSRGAAAVLTRVPLAGGPAEQFASYPLRRPVGLVVTGLELVLLDALVPETIISRWRPTGPEHLHTARNLSHWLVADDALLFADAAGVQCLRGGTVELWHAAERVMGFDEALNMLQQLPPEELLTPAGAGTALLHQPGPPPTITRLSGVWAPFRLVAAGSRRFLRHQSELLPLADLRQRYPLPGAEFGPVVPLGTGLLYLNGEGQLYASPDGRQWEPAPLPGRYSQLVPVAPTEVLATSRRSTVLLRAG